MPEGSSSEFQSGEGGAPPPNADIEAMEAEESLEQVNARLEADGYPPLPEPHFHYTSPAARGLESHDLYGVNLSVREESWRRHNDNVRAKEAAPEPEPESAEEVSVPDVNEQLEAEGYPALPVPRVHKSSPTARAFQTFELSGYSDEERAASWRAHIDGEREKEVATGEEQPRPEPVVVAEPSSRRVEHRPQEYVAEANIKDAYPLNLQEEAELLEVRRGAAEHVLDELNEHDHLVLGTAARNGTTSTLNLFESIATENEGADVVHLSAEGSIRDLGRELRKLKDSGRPIIVIIDEAGHLRTADENRDSERASESMVKMVDNFLDIAEEAKSRGVKFVFQTHDNLENGGIDAFAKWLSEKLPEVGDVGTTQLETVNDEGMDKLFDAMIKKYELPEELAERKGEVTSRFATPLQMSVFLSAFRGAYRGNPDIDAAWEVAAKSRRRDQMGDHFTYESAIMTTGGEQLMEMMKRVAKEGRVEVSELSESEKSLLERYKKFHFFRLADDGNSIEVRGTDVVDYLNSKG